MGAKCEETMDSERVGNRGCTERQFGCDRLE